MTPEEQLSFFSNWQNIFSGLLQEQSEYIVEALSRKLDAKSLRQLVSVDELISEVVAATQSTVSMVLDERAKQAVRTVDPSPFSSTGTWTVQTLRLLHQAVTFDWLPLEHSGTYREIQVWVGGPQSTPDTARFVPPNPDEVPERVSGLIDWWRGKFTEVTNGTPQAKLLAITEFHGRLLYIHPFLDGNGRLARFILAIQVQELLGVGQSVRITERSSYLSALDAAHAGNLEPLRMILSQAIFGIEGA